MVIADAAGYTMVKKSWFNGIAMPSIAVRRLERHHRHRPTIHLPRLRIQSVVTPRVTRRAWHVSLRSFERNNMKQNLLIIGAGGVAHVAAHKAAQHNDQLGDICIASRTLAKCDEIIASVQRKGHLKDPSKKFHAVQLDAFDIDATSALIRETNSQIVVNLGTAFLNMSVLEACLATGAAYIDTAIHEDPETVCEDPPWYANHEWKRKDRCAEAGVTASAWRRVRPGRRERLLQARGR